jgi:uncharacterized protein (TIGR02145 family)
MMPINTPTLIKTALATLLLIVAAQANMWRNQPEPTEQPWKSGATTVTLDKYDRTLRVSGNGAMEDYGWDDDDWTPWYYTGYTAVVIEGGVTHIGDGALSMSRLQSITVAADNADYSSEDGVLFNKDKTILILYPRDRQDSAYVIPNGVTMIEKNAFRLADKLTSVTIPNSVISVKGRAFAHCWNLTSITIPGSVKAIGYNAFVRCSNLTSVTIEDGGIAIGDNAFESCDNLTSVTIGNGAKCIGKEVFWGCGNLTSVTIGTGAAIIYDKAFMGYKKLTSVTIGEGATYIGADVFNGCENLTSVTIPKSVKYIGRRAFKDCHSLATIIILNPKPPDVGFDAFDINNRNRADLYVPASGFFSYRASDKWRSFGNVKPIGVIRIALCILAAALLLSAAVFRVIKKSRKSSAALTVIAALWLSGCADNNGGNPPELVGHWIYTNGNHWKPRNNIILYKDGTGEINTCIALTWFVENKRLIMQMPCVYLSDELTISYKEANNYNVSGYKLTLTITTDYGIDSAEFVNSENWTREIKKNSIYFTDRRDRRRYRAVTIGGKTWMAENLNYNTLRSWCYNHDNSRCKQYGRLYDWNAAMTACPAGWHLPTRREWADLVAAAGGKDTAGRALKSTDGGWPNDGGGLDIYGFSAMAGGFRVYYPDDQGFGNSGVDGSWWTATEDFDSHAYDQGLYYKDDIVREHIIHKRSGSSIRCIRDDGTEERKMAEAEKQKEEEKRKAEAAQRIENASVYFTDSRDGKTYRAVTIGGKTWMAQNLNYQARASCWCYDNNDSNCDKYGKLYDWDAAQTACPAGWHLPSAEEWDGLAAATGGNTLSGNTLKAVSGWIHDGNGSDEYGFSALPGGLRRPEGNFRKDGYYGHWWTSRGIWGKAAYYRSIFYYDDAINSDDLGKDYGFSVRCVADK